VVAIAAATVAVTAKAAETTAGPGTAAGGSTSR